MPHNLLFKIENTIKDLTTQGSKSLVVFDLDSTLFDVSPRLQQIIVDFAALEENQKKFPSQIAKFHHVKTTPSDWGIKLALQRAGINDEHPEFHSTIMQFWIEKFFSNHYLHFDQPIPGAVDYVNAIAEAGADIVYLTGRDIERMAIGSEEVLKKWGLPLNHKATLQLKPHKSMDDAEFKTDWFIEAQKKSYSKIYFFENEPVILHRMAEKCPGIECIFLDSTHSGKAHPPENLPRLMNFLRTRHPHTK